jgi:protein-disulfide isomerase
MREGTLTPQVSEHDHVQGSPNAPIVLVEYGDYQCPSCGMAYPLLKAVQRALGDELCLVYRNFPLREIHPNAEHAAESAETVAAEKGNDAFWTMHDTLFEHQDALGVKHLIRYANSVGVDEETLISALEEGTYEPRVRSDFRGGVRSGVNGTPTFFINGERYDGMWSDAGAFVSALRDAAQASGTSR